MSQAEQTPILSSEIISFVRAGGAVAVATRDEGLRPTVTRGWGPDVSADGRVLTLLVVAPPGSPTHANLAGNGAIAVGFGFPSIARALQVKGVVAAIRPAEPSELERAEQHVQRFSAEVEPLGISERLIRRIFPPESDFVSVTFTVLEAFDQTPGPTAGRRL